MRTRSPSLATLLSLLVAIAGVALASQVDIPLRLVPITLQSLAVVLTGFLIGPEWGFVAIVLWLAAGAAGLPVFADGEGGIRHLTGPTAGYLLAFPFAAALAGYGSRPAKRSAGLQLFLVAIAAHALILAAGGWWLSTKVGMTAALNKGVVPFLPGAVLKSAVAAILMVVIRRSLFRIR